MNIDSVISQIRVECEKYKESLQKSCDIESLERLKDRLNKEFSIYLPNEYEHFLAITNGLDWNGLVFFADEKSLISGYSDRFIQGLVDQNIRLANDNDELSQMLWLGESGGEYYMYDIGMSNYGIVEAVSLEMIERYSSFTKLLHALVEQRL